MCFFRKLVPLISFLVFLFLFFRVSWDSYGFELDNFERVEVQKTTIRLLEYERSFLERSFKNFQIYREIIFKEVKKAGLPDILVYLPIIESGCSPRAHSRAGAVGLWQIMPSTAYDYNLRIDYWVDERKDPVKSTKVALKYLQRLFRYYHNWELALAAYNSGPANVNRAIKKGNSRDYWILRKRGLLSRETSWYIPRFYAIVKIAEEPESFNLNIKSEKIKDFNFQIIELEKSVSLKELCRRAGVSYSELRFLNPELRKAITPPGKKYRLKVPVNSFGSFLSAYHGIKKEFIEDVTIYTVRSGDTIGDIAEKFSTSIQLIKLINGLRNSRIYAGQELIIPVNNKKVASRVSDSSRMVNYRGWYTSSIRYRVRKGDTVWNISKRFRIEMEIILALNGLGYNETLRPGDELLIPVSHLLSP